PAFLLLRSQYLLRAMSHAPRPPPPRTLPPRSSPDSAAPAAAALHLRPRPQNSRHTQSSPAASSASLLPRRAARPLAAPRDRPEFPAAAHISGTPPPYA